MNRKERGEKIRQQILRDVKHHPRDIAKHISKIFSITPQAVYNHIKRLETSGWLSSDGIGKGKKYFLGELREYKSFFSLQDNLEEDRIWSDNYAFIFEGLAENIIDICHYGFTEMVNNAIDHSGGSIIYISVVRSLDAVVIQVVDDGEGVFKKIKRLCALSDERQALFELSKGKLTTDPENHTGEGIFFTSRAFEVFDINSKGITFSHDERYKFDYLFDSGISKNKAGTLIYMQINKASNRSIQVVFDDFAAPDEFQFNKTVIPVRLAQYENEKLVSRSQAKRMLIRIETFQNVIFDFEGVASIGQAFADEIFRVYARRHPKIILLPINMEQGVSRMVNRAMLALKNETNA